MFQLGNSGKSNCVRMEIRNNRRNLICEIVHSKWCFPKYNLTYSLKQTDSTCANKYSNQMSEFDPGCYSNPLSLSYKADALTILPKGAARD